MKLLFILSTPRSGSTLISRLLAAHEDLAVTGETWSLYPSLAPLHGETHGHYTDAFAQNGIRHLQEILPGGREDYLRAVRAYADALYPRLQTGLQARQPKARWLVDKNPRYHLFYRELRALFPEASFLFLMRNPLAVAASYLTTWTPGIWSLPYLEPMLLQDFREFAAALDNTGGLHHHVMKFEDLLAQPQTELDALSLFLGLSSPLQPDRLADLSGPGDGRRRKSSSLKPVRAEAWAEVFRSPTRRRWARGLLDRLPGTYARLGYSPDALRAALEKPRARWWNPADAIAAFLLRRIRRKAGPDLLLDLVWKARQRVKIRNSRRRHRPAPSWMD